MCFITIACSIIIPLTFLHLSFQSHFVQPLLACFSQSLQHTNYFQIFCALRIHSVKTFVLFLILRMAESSRSSSRSSDSEKQKAFIDLHRQSSLSNSSVSTIIDSDFCPKEDNNNSLVIPANAEKLSDPERWKELPSTPSKPPLKGRFLVPDPSPAPTVSDTESMITAPERCSPYVLRRGEHVQRPSSLEAL